MIPHQRGASLVCSCCSVGVHTSWRGVVQLSGPQDCDPFSFEDSSVQVASGLLKLLRPPTRFPKKRIPGLHLSRRHGGPETCCRNDLRWMHGAAMYSQRRLVLVPGQQVLPYFSQVFLLRRQITSFFQHQVSIKPDLDGRGGARL